MIRSLFLILLNTLLSVIAFGQQLFYQPDESIPVTWKEKVLINPWAGGLDAPQLSNMDLNNDGQLDIVIFDRTSQTIECFIRENGDFVYAPEYAQYFPPELNNWVLLRDIDKDGKSDIFTSSPLGMMIFRNVSDESGLRFRLYNDRSPGPSPLLTIGFNGPLNLQMNASDIPSIEDMDGDGDLDILVFRFSGSNTVEWHKNMSVENGHGLDTLEMVRESQAWGNFKECFCGIYAYHGTNCATSNGKVEHVGGKTLAAMDWDGDNDIDLFVSEETCNDSYLLESDGSEYIGQIPQEIGLGLPFPAIYRIDVDGDGIRDMVVAPNVVSHLNHDLDFSSVVRLYLNRGTEKKPEFEDVSHSFLQDEMIDVGSSAAAAFFDIDRDGDEDMFLGSHHLNFEGGIKSSIRFLENTGTSGSPAFNLIDEDYLSLSEKGYYAIQPVFADVTGDGLLDLVFQANTADHQTKIFYIKNMATSADPFSGAPVTIFQSINDGDSFSLYDVDGDKTTDLIIGRSNGEVDLFHGTFMENEVQFALRESGFLGLNADALKRRPRIVMVDLDSDNRIDALLSYGNGTLEWAPDVLNGNTDFQPLPEMYSFPHGPTVFVTAVNIFNENRPSLFLGTDRGGLIVLRSEGNEQLPQDEVSVFPNPVLDEDSFVHIRSDKPVDIVIMNLLGQQVKGGIRIGKGDTGTVNIGGLANGIYIILGRQGDDVLFSRRLAIIR